VGLKLHTRRWVGHRTGVFEKIGKRIQGFEDLVLINLLLAICC
jgi:hypothetical protein